MLDFPSFDYCENDSRCLSKQPPKKLSLRFLLSTSLTSFPMMKLILNVIILMTFFTTKMMTHAFMVPTIHYYNNNNNMITSNHHHTRCHAAATVFTKFSDECLRALEVANTYATTASNNKKEQAALVECLDETHVFYGLAEFPGRTETWWTTHGFTLERLKSILDTYSASSSMAVTTANQSQSRANRTLRLASFKEQIQKRQQQHRPKMLPYSKKLQEYFIRAATIMDEMGDTIIEPQHVLLSFLHYHEFQEENDDDIEIRAATRGDDCQVMEILYNIDATLEGDEICQELLQILYQDNISALEQQETESTIKTTATTNDAIPKRAEKTSSPSTTATSKSSSNSGKNQPYSFLKEFGIDMTQLARDGAYDRIHGRQTEIESCWRILLRRQKNNVVLIGQAGVGKTALAHALAQVLIKDDQCPVLLRGCRMIGIELSSLVAGTMYRGAFEERFRGILDEIVQDSSTRTILFLDEMHGLMGSGQTENGNGSDAANLLKPYLANPRLRVVGATTIADYNRCIAKDAALNRRFQPVLIQEPTVEETVQILQALLPFYQSHHRVEYEKESLELAARLSERYLTERRLPDSAIDLMDEAGALATLRRTPDRPPPVVDSQLITDIVADWSGIPVGALQMDERQRLEKLQDQMSKRVLGQERAVQAVARAIRRSRTGVRDPKRPVASFLFCGSTGVGKTELCKTLADTYFGSEKNLIRIDMSEYSEKFTVSRLCGPPPGYVGHESGGVLTESVRRAPHSVVLLDELEKACPDVWNVLLQVIDDGILTDGKGQTVSFKNTVIIMTSNIGSQKILEMVNEKSSSLSSRPRYADLVGVVKTELEATMKPEFLNRIDEIVIFEPLSERELHGIATVMCLNIASRIRLERDVDITVQPTLLQKIVRDGGRAAAQFGARPMRRAVQHILENAISEAFVQGFLIEGDSVSFNLLVNDDETNLYSGNDEECGVDGMRSFCVTATRSRDNKILDVNIEESCRDLVLEVADTNDPAVPQINVTTIHEKRERGVNGENSTTNTAPASMTKN